MAKNTKSLTHNISFLIPHLGPINMLTSNFTKKTKINTNTIAEKVARFLYYKEGEPPPGSWTYLAPSIKESYRKQARDIQRVIRTHLNEQPKPVDYQKELES
jgi:hypothetical protein